MPNYRNISFATVDSVADVLTSGVEVRVRGKLTRELLGRVTSLERPYERYLFVPKRHSDVFAQFAETMWMLAGRDDIAWLTRYLPRAPEFSDDGTTWHGAYGPRLRRWCGSIDQLDEARQLLTKDLASRRAVMMVFDPARDYVDSKDIPCNNWLSWIARNGKLHLNVAVRSNDAMWGFSGVNAFEWSVLQELMSFWLGLENGPATYFATSFHLYDIHFDRVRQMNNSFHGLTPYDFGIGRAPFRTLWDEFECKLKKWFIVEEKIRAEPNVPLFQHGRVDDPFLDSGLALIHVFWAHRQWGAERLVKELGQLPAEDYVVAIYDQLRRLYPALTDNIAQPEIRRFFEACRGISVNASDDFKLAIKRLHAEKDRAYGGAWKRRGELVSILPNIARKADRLENLVQTGATMRGESLLDTVIDLYVYVEKYRLFLAEHLEDNDLLPNDARKPYSDHDANFDTLVDRLDLQMPTQSTKELISDVVTRFDACWRNAETRGDTAEQFELATKLAEAAGALIARVVADDTVALARFVRSEVQHAGR
ncbi:thymidylate synthase [Afipia sp. OHSU_II-C1]|jgi:thymidylate synthase|nr:thymidylate synthase [Afipia sp. OHSU_II-C1]